MADERGKEFARRQLEKYGWKQGKGLGKAEDGISKAIKVGIKNDTNGVGYDLGEQFTFHWWDHVFNKTAQSLVVEECADGVKVSKNEKVTYKSLYNKKPNKHSGTALLYGRFVKASSAELQPMSSDSELEEEPSAKGSEDKLFSACGGRTAHKAARHGFKLNGKLLRLEKQEKRTLSAASSENNSPVVSDSEEKVLRTANSMGRKDEKRKKKTKKRQKLSEKETTVSELAEKSSLKCCHTGCVKETASKRKRKNKRCPEDSTQESTSEIYTTESTSLENDLTQTVQECLDNRPKKSKKKRRKLEGSAVRESSSSGDICSTAVIGGKKKKRKKKESANSSKDR